MSMVCRYDDVGIAIHRDMTMSTVCSAVPCEPHLINTQYISYELCVYKAFQNPPPHDGTACTR
jgi:hypothetical protein